MRLIDTAVFRRLKDVSQLGLVGFVYPGATHSRFEHSLGVYRNALLFLQRLGSLPDFEAVCSSKDAELLIVSSLLHDIGQGPFCHAIEDMQLPGYPKHERFAQQLFEDTALQQRLSQDWDCQVSEVVELLAPANSKQPKFALLGTILSGPIDIDKLDYLDRDSLHAGVPYGRNFDRNRLISQLCLGSDQASLAITEKGRTAAEMMIFARYVMFSEVYWHHAVRSATSMLQRAVWEARNEDLSRWRSLGDIQFIEELRAFAENRSVSRIVDLLFGSQRCLYKRLAEYHALDQPDLHRVLARRPYDQLVSLSERLTTKLSSMIGKDIHPLDVLIDAPPVKLEVQFNISVRMQSGTFRSLGELSPVAAALASQQFDSLVKRVRVFVHPDLKDQLASVELPRVLEAII
jgi:uncharacterized protein